MVSGMRSRNWQALLRYRLGQNCPPLFEEWGLFFFSHLKWNFCCCLELVSSLSGVLALVREQVRSHSGKKVGPRDVDRKEAWLSLSSLACRLPWGQPRARCPRVGPHQSPCSSIAGTVPGLPVPSKGVSDMEHGRQGRDVWECSLSDFPQIHRFVQSPEDPTMKNTAPGRGDRGRPDGLPTLRYDPDTKVSSLTPYSRIRARLRRVWCLPALPESQL